jgi:hypothetical protein
MITGNLSELYLVSKRDINHGDYEPELQLKFKLVPRCEHNPSRYSENRTKHVSALCGQNVEFFYPTLRGT